jgi:hypothetical protein
MIFLKKELEIQYLTFHFERSDIWYSDNIMCTELHLRYKSWSVWIAQHREKKEKAVFLL